MFAALLNRLTADTPDQLEATDARLAMAALLVRLARTDGHYASSEAARIDLILARHYQLTDGDAQALRAEAEILETEAPDTVRFTRAIKDHTAHEDRDRVIEDIWELALADGSRSDDEDSLIRMVAPLLGINDRDSALARQRVIERLNG
ncbi:TerB family tellurite resistance protein [uncultured Litoreibacter sp.]|uniref:tellurite resistance TerB family protein n=1 Tax=uncultured Litoreibacter sp. TaxID=1392394 RepID=UPI0026369012|nr:TerB family tellurite resistance protein [uncultured Litoreibacter sp.]